jgi:hypothetical protein
MEAIGRNGAIEPYLSTVVLGGGVLRHAGTDAQKAALIPEVIEGKRTLALAHQERQSRFDLADVSTKARPDGNGGYTKGYLVSVSGFAPADDPQYVVSVSLADPVNMNSSAASAPIFQEVMSQVLKKYRAVPSGATAPDLSGTW